MEAKTNANLTSIALSLFHDQKIFLKFGLSSFILAGAAQYALHESSPLTALMTVARKMTPNIMRAPNCFENS